jgi:hypothetical protein
MPDARELKIFKHKIETDRGRGDPLARVLW